MEKERNGLVNSALDESKRASIKYVVANTVEAVKQLISKKERGEIFEYCFIALRRNGDRVFAVEGVN